MKRWVLSIGLATALLAGCTSATQTPSATLASGSSSTSNSPTPAETTSATSSEVATPPAPFPEDGRGAEAFTRYFMTQANSAYTELNPVLITTLSVSNCKTCGQMASSISAYAAKRQHYEGAFVSPLTLTVQRVADGKASVFMTTKTPASRVLDADGKLVETVPADNTSFLVSLVQSGKSGWRVSEIQSSS